MLVPIELKNLQEWFATIIVNPLVDGHINPISPCGIDIKAESACFISPSTKLKPHQRIEIYNQQYWWRLIDILQINYSLTLRILGVECFNKISIKYLMDNPPNHWSLFHVSKDFSEWIKKNYNAQYSDIVYFSSQLDLIFYYSSIEFKYSSFKINFYEKNELENLLTKNIQLQPHVSITEYPFDLLSFREEVIKKEPIYWQKHKFPELALVPYYCVIFRNRKNNIAWKKISYAEFLLIKQFEEGSCILQVCDWINQNDVTQKEIMTANFHNWIKSWFELELFILDKT